MRLSPRPGLLPMRHGRTPRDCQMAAARAFQHHMKLGTKRMLTQLATGSGKGCIIAGLLVRTAWAGKRALFVCNRDFLIGDVYDRAMSVEPALYAGRVQGRLNQVDRHSVFASLQTVSNEQRAREIGPVDIIFIDEAHGFLCESGLTLLRVMEELNPNVRIAGYTATAYRAAANGKTSGLGALFGPDVGGTAEPIFTYSLSQGIEDGVLCPLKGVHVKPLLGSGYDPNDNRTIAAILDTPEHNAYVIRSWLEHGGGKAIAFCSDVPHAIHLAEVAREKFGIKADAVWESSSQKDPRTGEKIGTDRERDEKIARALGGELQLLTNYNLLSTGFDWPECSFMLSCQLTGSAVLWPQQVGRITRFLPGKVGYVLDYVGNALTHDLGLGPDMTTPRYKPKSLDPGDVVRHRHDPDRFEGIVVETENDGQRAKVRWRGPPPDWYDADDLVITRKRSECETISVAPTTIGLDPCPVELIRGDASAGWHMQAFTVNEKPVKTWTLRVLMPIGEASIHVRPSAGMFDLWMVPEKNGVPELWRAGVANREDAMVYGVARVREMDGRIDKPDEPWKRVASTPQQHGRLRGKFKIRRDLTNATKGECAAMISACVANQAILDLADPKRIEARRLSGIRFGGKRTA